MRLSVLRGGGGRRLRAKPLCRVRGSFPPPLRGTRLNLAGRESGRRSTVAGPKPAYPRGRQPPASCSCPAPRAETWPARAGAARGDQARALLQVGFAGLLETPPGQPRCAWPGAYGRGRGVTPGCGDPRCPPVPGGRPCAWAKPGVSRHRTLFLQTWSRRAARAGFGHLGGDVLRWVEARQSP